MLLIFNLDTCREEMEAEGQGFTNGHATWTSAMSSFMLSYLSNVVSSGERTSSGFKKVHYNSCAKAMDEEHYNGYVKVLILLLTICVQSAICV
jgi:hypothetical protein